MTTIDQQRSENKGIEKRIDAIEEKLDKLWSVEQRILEELSMLKSKSRVDRREVNRLENIVVSLLEEISVLKHGGESNMYRIEDAVKKYLRRESGSSSES
jgi:tetrahydromethanopterin S-methyltransferase subunit G